MSDQVSEDDNVIVATLVRGKTYTFHHTDNGKTVQYIAFERGVPKTVSEEVAGILEDLTEDVPDGDGDVITKDMFRIERDATALSITPAKKVARFRIIREEVEERPPLVAARKPMAAPAKPKAGTFPPRRNG